MLSYKSIFLTQRFNKNSITKISKRLQHTVQCKEIRLKEFSGDFEKSLELHKSQLNTSLNSENKNQLLVKLVAAPINPADINIIQGKYGVLPKNLPAPLGNEGVFEVVSIENTNSHFKIGDRVLANKLQFATWRSHVIDSEKNFIKIPSGLETSATATLSVNPITALRMMQDFKKLSPGDTIIQNGANSGVGQAVIQLGKVFKVNVVNIVRKRENQEQLNEYLRSLGAEYVFTEDMLRKTELTKDLWINIPKPRLALNCVGGRATTDMVRLMDKNSVMVTYGGMSKQPLMLNTADFIFKDFKACGFWLTRWRQENPEEYKKSIKELCELIGTGDFKGPKTEKFKFEDYMEAFKRNSTPFINSKVLIVN